MRKSCKKYEGQFRITDDKLITIFRRLKELDILDDKTKNLNLAKFERVE